MPRQTSIRITAVAVALSLTGLVAAAASPTPRPADVDISAVAIAPAEVITLFDGKTVNDMRHFYTWLTGKGYDDPNGVFSVAADVDGAPAIRVSGQDWGGFVTRKNYRDYRLVLEYRWSDKTWSQRARNSGVLFHARGEDGNYNSQFNSPWLASVEYEIQEGRTGAVILVGGSNRDGTRMQPVITMRTKQHSIWDPTGEPRKFGGGFLFQSTYDVGWKDVRGFRGTNDPDKPIGEWNRAEIITRGGDITYFLNGHKFLEATDGSFTDGRIMFQSEGAEIFFRLIELHPLDAAARPGP
ncbi:MAG: DUF1080 domain-containing protein [Pirellulales bacterium]